MCYCTPNLRTPFCSNCASFLAKEVQRYKRLTMMAEEAIRFGVYLNDYQREKLIDYIGFDTKDVPKVYRPED